MAIPSPLVLHPAATVLASSAQAPHRARNRGSFALLLVVTTAISSWLAIAANRARREAFEDRAQAEEVSEFLIAAFHKPVPSSDGYKLKVVDLLDEAVRQLGSEFKGSPKIQVALLHALGKTYLGLGIYDRAVPVLEDVGRLARPAFVAEDSRVLVTRHSLALAYEKAGRLSESIALYEATIRAQTDKLGHDDPETLKTRVNFANAYIASGRLDEGIKMNEIILKIHE